MLNVLYNIINLSRQFLSVNFYFNFFLISHELIYYFKFSFCHRQRVCMYMYIFLCKLGCTYFSPRTFPILSLFLFYFPHRFAASFSFILSAVYCCKKGPNVANVKVHFTYERLNGNGSHHLTGTSIDRLVDGYQKNYKNHIPDLSTNIISISM